LAGIIRQKGTCLLNHYIRDKGKYWWSGNWYCYSY
jgi:hypothetical protein